MRAKTRATSAAVRARYGTVSRFLGSLTIRSTAGILSVHLFDLPGPKRVYAWLDPSSDEVVVDVHCADISSPHEAVVAGRRRDTYRLKVERVALTPT
jgi:signal recognition particle receptor subunit beta